LNGGTHGRAAQRKIVHEDIKLNTDPKLASRFLDVPNMPWEKTKFPGIEIKVLYADDDGLTTALFRLQPGAVVPLHEHTALEQTYVLEGTLEDHEGVCGPRTVRVAPAGNQHEATAPNGALIPWLFPEAEPVRLRREVLHRRRGTLGPSPGISAAKRQRAMAWLEPVTLQSGHVRLEPLATGIARI
jgi:hypothetical protein